MDNQAQLIAINLIQVAKENGFIENNQLNTIQALADVERDFFIELLKEFDAKLKNRDSQELTLDEISSLFSFVFGKSAEAVTNHVNKSKQEFEFLGMFDGKVPIYVDDRLMGALKQSLIPVKLAEAFVNFQTDNPTLIQNPELALFEALKWTWRIGQNFSINFVSPTG